MLEVLSLFEKIKYHSGGWKLEAAGIVRGTDVISARFVGAGGRRAEIRLRRAGRWEPGAGTEFFELQIAGPEEARGAGERLLEAVRAALAEAEAGPDFPAGVFSGLLAPEVPQVDIWITSKCNQKCVICDIPAGWELVPGSPEAVRKEIAEKYRRGARGIKFAGRECTLEKEFAGYIEFCKRTGYETVQVMTNAVALENRRLAAKLKSAGLDRAVVSLHGHEAGTADSITGVPGDFNRTLRGIENIMAAGILLELNFVICEGNYRSFPEYVRFVKERFGGAARRLMVSSVVPAYRALENYGGVVPRLTDIMPFVEEGLAYCREEKVPAYVPDLCGFPACFAPGFVEMFEAVRRQRFAEVVEMKTKPEGCAACRAVSYCDGHWAEYFRIYGDSEFAGRRF